MSTESRGVDVLKWAATVFGPVALDRRERAIRLVEEALEVAQAEGVDPDMVRRVVQRVFSRPVGDVQAEVGAVVITLEALARNAGIDAESAGAAEWRRVRALDPQRLALRHRKKILEGCAIDPGAPAAEPGEGRGL